MGTRDVLVAVTRKQIDCCTPTARIWAVKLSRRISTRRTRSQAVSITRGDWWLRMRRVATAMRSGMRSVIAMCTQLQAIVCWSGSICLMASAVKCQWVVRLCSVKHRAFVCAHWVLLSNSRAVLIILSPHSALIAYNLYVAVNVIGRAAIVAKRLRV